VVRHALAAIFQTREFVAAGGLMSYGGSLLDVFRIAGTYTGRILKGDKPANVPVQQVSQFELFKNQALQEERRKTCPGHAKPVAASPCDLGSLMPRPQRHPRAAGQIGIWLAVGGCLCATLRHVSCRR
jgi:ABC transporter substrate binding protein